MKQPGAPPERDSALLPSEKIIALRDAFERHEIPYAFGGAIALFYYRDPRSTLDIDVNVFLAPERKAEVIVVLRGLYELDAQQVANDIASTGQARSAWGPTFIDLFFSDTEFHDAMATRTKREQFLGTEINVLSAEDLLVCKMLFDRPKDWVDVEAVVGAIGERLDPPYIESALALFVEPADDRFERWRAILRA